MRVNIFLVWLIVHLSLAISGPIAEFDAELLSGLSVNNRHEIDRWSDVRTTGSLSWSLAALTGNKPVFVRNEAPARPHVHFSLSQRLLLNFSTPVYMDTGSTGSTLAIVIKNEAKGSSIIFGGTGGRYADNAQIRFNNPTSLRISTPVTSSLFTIENSTNVFHSYVIRSGNNKIDVFQDDKLVDSKQVSHLLGKHNTKMNCLGCSLSNINLQGRVSYLAFYDVAIDNQDLSPVLAKLKLITQESNAVIMESSHHVHVHSLAIESPRSSSSSPLQQSKTSTGRGVQELEPPAPAPAPAPAPPSKSHHALSIAAYHPSSSSRRQDDDVLLQSTAGDVLYVITNDTVQLAVKGMFVISVCVMIPWCIVLLCCMHQVFFVQSNYPTQLHMPPSKPVSSSSFSPPVRPGYYGIHRLARRPASRHRSHPSSSTSPSSCSSGGVALSGRGVALGLPSLPPLCRPHSVVTRPPSASVLLAR